LEIVTETIRNVLGIFDPGDLDSDPKIKSVPLLPRTDMWTMFEEGRLRRSNGIYRKRSWHIWPRLSWPLTLWPQTQYGCYATEDGCLDQVWER